MVVAQLHLAGDKDIARLHLAGAGNDCTLLVFWILLVRRRFLGIDRLDS